MKTTLRLRLAIVTLAAFAAARFWVLVDRFEFESPFGILGRIVDRLLLAGYMRRFLIRCNRVLKRLAESEEWRKYLRAT